MNYAPVEIKRCLSTSSSIVFYELNSTKINLIDTLGSNNFINAKRGKIQGIDTENDIQTVRVHVHMGEVLNYATDLTSMAGGMFVMEFDHYEGVPDHLTKKNN